MSAALTPQAAHAVTTLVVDDDGQGTAADCNAGAAAFNSIQAAVNAAAPGDTISICPGTYNEQVVVTTSNLTIRGAGAGSTVLRPATVVQNTFSVVTPIPVAVAPILLVNGAVGVTVTELTIDGSAADGGAAPLNCGITPHFTGIYYRNSSGTVDSAHVTKMKSATACGYGIRSESGAGGVANLVYSGSLVDQYGDTGMVCAGLDTACAITGNTVRGRGPVNEPQAGIIVRRGAVATISGNVITDHILLLANGVPESSVGIFLVNADPASNPHLLQRNLFANNQVDVQRVSTEAALH